MPIYATEAVEELPEMPLACWSIRKTNTGAMHFVGHSLIHCNGRVSTEIRSFDPLTRTGITASGRVYRLQGRAGMDKDAEYVWGLVVRGWGIKHWTDVTEQVVPDWRSPVPLSQDEGEQEFESD